MANGLRLHCLDYGAEGKPLVLCIHGLTGNAHNFDALAGLLASSYHALSLDVRGRGDSDWGPAADYNFAVYLSDLAALVEALGAPRLSLIGTSMGGMIAMMYAGGYPGHVERLVLNDIGPEVDAAGLKRITEFVSSAPSEFNDLAEVADYYRRTSPIAARASERALIEFVKWAVKPSADGRLTWKMDPAVRRPPRTGSAARPLDLWLHYTRVAAPILIVRGGESDVLSAETAERMRKIHPQARVVEVPGVAHAPTLVEPQALAAIRDFFGC